MEHARVHLYTYEEEDTCMSYEEEDTCTTRNGARTPPVYIYMYIRIYVCMHTYMYVCNIIYHTGKGGGTAALALRFVRKSLM